MNNNGRTAAEKLAAEAADGSIERRINGDPRISALVGKLSPSDRAALMSLLTDSGKLGRILSDPKTAEVLERLKGGRDNK